MEIKVNSVWRRSTENGQWVIVTKVLGNTVYTSTPGIWSKESFQRNFVFKGFFIPVKKGNISQDKLQNLEEAFKDLIKYLPSEKVLLLNQQFHRLKEFINIINETSQ